MQTHMQRPARSTFATPLGRCAISWEGAAITRFELPDAAARADDAEAPPEFVAEIIRRVGRHLVGGREDFSDLPYDFRRAPDFAREVYRATLAVKPGRTASYGAIAAAIGQPAAASRAVGAALGSNPWPLLVPCHRIVAADGRMTGFSGPGGIKTKLRLLALEGSELFAE
ncbi:MAG: methylated-DNA--protein-cysteine methyltransferase [Verrucomicrobia bacterium]|nr:methylated-DNA--protein-cysteine methyltransferase [Verrucomicrobiota bacterium]